MAMSRSSTNILDRPLGRSGGRAEGSVVSLSAFAYIYSELVQYHQQRAASISELERRLESAGYGVGLKVLEMTAYRAKEVSGRPWTIILLLDAHCSFVPPFSLIRHRRRDPPSRQTKRETRLMSILHFVSSSVWKSLFGKAADSLERSIDHADEYMIIDYEPIASTFVSIPPDLGQLSADAYVSGIVAGVLDGAGFTARVTAHSVKVEEGEYTRQGGNIIPGIPPRKDKAVFLVKFSPEVLTRDAALER
ncbi:hypothetical protein ACHAXA_002070 [Cyclostephanos tholiformis]|uniref:Trafficking protein particle complex subunit n=1 Tax=Cyclostephanos tholiformis TaxID=382380 RepID=A0ABD3SSZ5_9STRA